MPMIDVRCPNCHAEFEVFRHTADIDQMPACETPDCATQCERIYVYQRPHSYVGGTILTVIYRNPDGSIGTPGHRDGRIPEGSERIEIRSAVEARRYEKEMEQQEYTKHVNKQEREERTFGEHARQQRAELREKMKGFSERGKDFARAAMKQNDEAPRKQFRTNVFFDAFSNNASNRDGYRGDDHRQGRK